MKKVNKMCIIREVDFDVRLNLVQIPILSLMRVILGKLLNFADVLSFLSVIWD